MLLHLLSNMFGLLYNSLAYFSPVIKVACDPVVGSVGAIVVVSHWSLNLTSAMCTHSIVPGALLKLLDVLVAICKGMETLVRDVQSCMSLVRITLPILGNIPGTNCGKVAPLCIVISSAPMPQAGQWNTYSSTSHSTTRVWNLNPSVTLPVLAFTVNSGTAHVGSFSEVSMVGTMDTINKDTGSEGFISKSRIYTVTCADAR